MKRICGAASHTPVIPAFFCRIVSSSTLETCIMLAEGEDTPGHDATYLIWEVVFTLDPKH